MRCISYTYLAFTFLPKFLQARFDFGYFASISRRVAVREIAVDGHGLGVVGAGFFDPVLELIELP